MDRKKFRSQLNFEALAYLFFDLVEERYPSAEKTKQIISRVINPLTRDSWEGIQIKIAILSAIRNMVKEVAPGQIYRSLQHRDDLYLAILEALEDLEDELEEIEEKLSEEEEI